MARAYLDKKPAEIAAMFDAVGERYDRTNAVVSFGLDRLWRRRTRERLQLKPGEKVLDVAAGTAVSTVALAKSGAWCVACDFSMGMLAAGRDRDVPKVAGDGTKLPFADESFDAVTISYGIRNFSNYEEALQEFARVTKPGGRLVVAELSTPVIPVVSQFYKQVVLRLLPKVARLVSSDPESYDYLTESIRGWFKQEEFADIMSSNGWKDVGWQNLTFGAVALHYGVKK